MRIEVGEICVEVTGGGAHIERLMRLHLGHFFSKSNPDFTVRIRRKRASVGVMARIGDGDDGERLPSPRIVRHGSIFFVLLDLGRKGATAWSLGIGVVNVRVARCVFYDYGQEVSKWALGAFMRLCFQLFLAEKKGILIHACGMVNGKKAYIFAGPSGSGKSTLARLSRGLTVLSDDIVCLRRRDGCWKAYATPWRSAAPTSSAMVARVFFLERGARTAFVKLTPGESVLRLYSNLFAATLDDAVQTRVFDAVTEIARRVPCHIMSFSLKDPIWERIEALNGE